MKKQRDRVSNDLVNDVRLQNLREQEVRYSLTNSKLRFQDGYGYPGDQKGKYLKKYLPFSVLCLLLFFTGWAANQP